MIQQLRQGLALAVLLVGCGGMEAAEPTDPPERPMLHALWAAMGATPEDEEAPRVLWIEGEEADCGGASWWATRSDGSVYCIDGTVINWWWVKVGRAPGMTLADTALAHEFGHMLDWRRGGDGDPKHVSAAFQPGGTVNLGERWLADFQGVAPPLHAAALNARSDCVWAALAGSFGHEARSAGGHDGGRVQFGSDGHRPGR